MDYTGLINGLSRIIMRKRRAGLIKKQVDL